MFSKKLLSKYHVSNFLSSLEEKNTLKLAFKSFFEEVMKEIESRLKHNGKIPFRIDYQEKPFTHTKEIIIQNYPLNFSQNINPREIFLVKDKCKVEHFCEDDSEEFVKKWDGGLAMPKPKGLTMSQIIYDDEICLGAYCPYCKTLFIHKE